MLQLLLAAPSSGSGKTTAACALLSALKARGLEPCAFKCGPDYIDPMFHRAVLGVPSHNLDLLFSTPQTVRRLYTSGAAGHGSAVCEGAMGYYDGLGGVSAAASAWHTADVLDLPVLLVVHPKGASLTLAAQLQGLKAFRTPHHIAGVLLNDCTEMLYKLLAPMLERETGLPVVGFLPPMPDAAIESRHLGLKTAGEIADLQQKIQILTAAAQKNIDWPRLLALFPDACRRAACPAVVLCGGAGSVSVCRLAVAARMDAGRSAQALSIYRCFAGVDFPVALAGDAALAGRSDARSLDGQIYVSSRISGAAVFLADIPFVPGADTRRSAVCEMAGTVAPGEVAGCRMHLLGRIDGGVDCAAERPDATSLSV